jgi:hypothetical protein
MIRSTACPSRKKIWLIVDVHLGYHDGSRELARECLDVRRQNAAGWAPVRGEVDYGKAGSALDERGESCRVHVRDDNLRRAGVGH